jgi:hypothetical protein
MIEPLISEEKNVLRKCRSSTESIFVIQHLVEKRKEYDLETSFLSVDFKKVLFSVFHKGIPSHVVTVVQSLYHDTKICIKEENRQVRF